MAMIFTSDHLANHRALSCDVCVIGSGAGGAAVARELASAGRRVLVLEAGHFWRPAHFTQVEFDMFHRLYHEGGGRTTHDRAIHVHQGKGVGGSTLHNLNLCARAPATILETWREEYGLSSLPSSVLDALYDETEHALSVSELGPPELSRNNEILRRGCEALGYRGGFLRHNRVGCAASGFCELGCPFDAKENALKTLLTQAVRSGAQILADTWATHLAIDSGTRRVTGVHAIVRHPSTGLVLGRVDVDAQVVCVSASATGTPALLTRSGIPDPYSLVGSRLFLHPGTAVAARFPERVEAWRGIPQSYECTEFLDFAPDSNRRAWIVPTFAHPAGVSAVLSEFGDAHAQRMTDYAHLGALSTMVHDTRPGRVGPKGDFGVKIEYQLDHADASQLELGMRECARLLLAAGAERVIVPLTRSLEITSATEVDRAFEDFVVRPQDTDITSVHPMGSVWMGDDPRRSCVDSRGRYHHLDNLYVADTSLFCSSLGVPPQLTTYALGTHVGRQIRDAL